MNVRGTPKLLSDIGVFVLFRTVLNQFLGFQVRNQREQILAREGGGGEMRDECSEAVGEVCVLNVCDSRVFERVLSMRVELTANERLDMGTVRIAVVQQLAAVWRPHLFRFAVLHAVVAVIPAPPGRACSPRCCSTGFDQ